MKSSKLIAILGVLDSNEWEAFKQFLDSPYFHKFSNRNQQTIDLYRVLDEYYPDFKAEELSKERIEAQLFPDSENKPGRLEKVMSSMVKQLEHFIFVNRQLTKTNKFERKLALSQFYKERNLKRLNDIGIQQLQKSQSRLAIKDKGELYQDYLLEKEIAEIKSLRNPRDENLNYPQMIFALDQFFLASRLEHSCDLLHHINTHVNINPKSSLQLIEKLLPLEAMEKDRYHPLVLINEKVFQLFQTNDTDVEVILNIIKELETLLNKYKNQIPELMVKRLHSFNRTLMGKLFNLGHNYLLPKTLQLYKDHYANKLLFNGDGIPAANFKNMVSLCLLSNDLDWVFKFIKSNKDNIVGTENPKEVYAFNLANFYFHKNQISKAYDLLAHNFEDIFYKIGAKRLEIKILYEQQSELLEYKINAFKLYIHRLSKTKLPEIQCIGNNNFINILKQIISPANLSAAKKKKIRDKIKSSVQLFEKEWLLEKL